MKCRICKNEAEKFEEIKNMAKNVAILYETPKQSSGVNGEIYHCEKCDLYQIPCIVEDTYYDDYLMTASHSKKINKLQDEQIERIKQYVKDNGKFLEIGCGDGNFLSKASQVFKYALGIEPSKKFYNLCQEKKLNVKNIYLEDNTNLSGNFDVITARQVFEHLDKPVKVFNKMVEQCSDNGIIFIDVPNGGKSIKENRYYDFFSDHVNHYTVRSLSYLCESNGMQVLEIRESFDGDYLELYCKKMKVINGGVCEAADNAYDEISKIIKAYNKIAVYGAGAKTQVLFTMFSELLKSCEFIFDSDPFKEGKYLVNANVPVCGPDIDKIQSLDAIIIFAKSYSDEITDVLRNTYRFKGEIYYI